MIDAEGRDFPKLAPPGAGVPGYQKWVGKHVLLPLWCLSVPPARVPDRMELQAKALEDLARGWSAAQRERRVLVPPQIGLEDSSRFHSWALVVEHLAVIGNSLLGILVELTHGRTPPGEARTEAFKPRGEIGADQAIDEYRAMLRRLRRAIETGCPDWRSPARFPHPWFGPLGARQWASFAPFHQDIHLKQARRIRSLVLRSPGEG